MTVILRITLLIVCCVGAYSSLFGFPGRSYTLRSPKLRDLAKLHAAGTRPRKDYGKLSSSVFVKAVEVPNHLEDIVEAIKRVVRSSDFFEYSGSKIVQDPEYCLLSVPSQLIGWSNTLFRKQHIPRTAADGADSNNSHFAPEFEYITVDALNGHTHATGSIRIRYSFTYDEGEVKITRKSAHKGIDNARMDHVMEFMDELVITQVQRELDLIAARARQQTAYKRKALVETKKRKVKELDKIINPEKYRNHSPSVRRMGSGVAGSAASGTGGGTGGGGSGRYTPSAGTQARRQVKRGG